MPGFVLLTTLLEKAIHLPCLDLAPYGFKCCLHEAIVAFLAVNLDFRTKRIK